MTTFIAIKCTKKHKLKLFLTARIRVGPCRRTRIHNTGENYVHTCSPSPCWEWELSPPLVPGRCGGPRVWPRGACALQPASRHFEKRFKTKLSCLAYHLATWSMRTPACRPPYWTKNVQTKISCLHHLATYAHSGLSAAILKKKLKQSKLFTSSCHVEHAHSGLSAAILKRDLKQN
jgi:hypothetical protein